MALELDHLFCFVDPSGAGATRARDAGWVLDEGIEHGGQGTRNRRLWLPELYLELIWLSSRADAENNALRLDRRADWRMTGGCPFGIGLRGQLDATLRSEFWAYNPPYAPEACIWIHRSNETEWAAPLVFVIETPREEVEGCQPRVRLADRSHMLGHARPAIVQQVALKTPVAPSRHGVQNVTPRVVWSQGSPQSLRLIFSNASIPVLELTDEIMLVG